MNFNSLKEIFSSEDGRLSSKRVIGSAAFASVIGCVIYLVINEGGTNAVENLLQTLMIISASLLGVDSVTNIWRGKGKNPPTPKSE